MPAGKRRFKAVEQDGVTEWLFMRLSTYVKQEHELVEEHKKAVTLRDTYIRKIKPRVSLAQINSVTGLSRARIQQVAPGTDREDGSDRIGAGEPDDGVTEIISMQLLAYVKQEEELDEELEKVRRLRDRYIRKLKLRGVTLDELADVTARSRGRIQQLAPRTGE
ncbi:MAG TPA: hypothetical protein VFT80_00530 [Actinomycetota bacterium]|nr:hypothetical protein [Actinomycetota bacterium]